MNKNYFTNQAQILKSIRQAP